MTGLSPLTEFALLARAHDDVLDLERLAVAIARMGTPALDGAAVSRTLDDLASLVADDVPRSASPDRTATALRDAIAGRLGFRGDPTADRSAEDSYLDVVLAHRRGLPILLSVVWILLGQRLGVPIAGVNYPGHFLVCLDAPGARVFLDPFHAGAAREGSELLARVGGRPADRKLLEPCGTRPIVARMLANLKNLWVDQQDYGNALGAIDRILLVSGEVPSELRDRGLVCLHLHRPAEARRDFERYLKIRPEADDRPVVEALLTRIRESS